MDAIELRIGNYLERYGEIVKIVEIGIKHKNDTNYYLRCVGDNSGYWINQFKPIPLTEEILLKCGLNRNFSKIKECSNSILEFEFIENRIDLWLTYKKEEDITIYSQLPHIKYLHQLQNLYFALTNKELEINI